jgi:hypothetical protein
MADRRRFVVLEHRWDGVHWDFMVEIAPGSALRTWAIDAEPTTGRDLPARALADHRRAYLTHEGEVSGGRGTVRRWDEGTCDVEVWRIDRVRLVLGGGQLTGPVELWTSPPVGEGLASGTASASGAGGGSASSWTFRLGKLIRSA